MRPATPKRAAQNRERARLVRAFLQANPVCQRCWAARSVDCHERRKKSRDPRAFLDPTVWAALCRSCHDWTEQEPAAALATGWLLPSES